MHIVGIHKYILWVFIKGALRFNVYAMYFDCYKNDDFQMQRCDIFLIFAQNIDCRYTLESPH